MLVFSHTLLPPRHAPMANEKINGFIGKLTSGSLLRLRSTGICGLRRKRKVQETLSNNPHTINKIHLSDPLKPPASPKNNLKGFFFYFLFKKYN